jgi:hypothetical protein
MFGGGTIMLEERMERVKSLLVERLTDGMDFVELGRIREKGIAPLLTQWLTDRAKASLKREQGRRADSGLSYDHPRVKVILERLDDVLLDVIVFPKTEIEQVVAEQIRWETMLRIRPVEAIVQFFLPKEGTLSVAELVEAFPKLPLQAFYGEGIKAYAAEHLEEVMDREALVGMLHGIENRELATDAVEVVMNAASTTLGLLKQRHAEDGDEIDLDIIEHILNYYRMGDQARVIKVEQMLGRERLTLGQVRRILEMTGHLDETGETAASSLEAGEEIVSIGENEGEEAVGDENEGEMREGEEQAGQDSGGVEESSGAATPGRSGVAEGEEVFEVVERPEEVFRKRVDEKEERYFIRKLFARDREIYELLMAQLEGISVLEEARRTIRKFWEDHGIDAGSKAAERFTNTIYAWYADSP